MKSQGKSGIGRMARKFIDEGCEGWIVIRSGALGCYFIKKGMSDGTWIPAYHQSTDKVVDVTGAGNSFLVSSICSYCQG